MNDCMLDTGSIHSPRGLRREKISQGQVTLRIVRVDSR